MPPPAPQELRRDFERLLLGAMSGTSCDGVDVALVASTRQDRRRTARYLAHVERPFDPDLRHDLLDLRQRQAGDFPQLADVGRRLTLAYAHATLDLLEQTGLKPRHIDAIGAHGQTLYHDPPHTIQWLDPSLLAAMTGLTVISDFRRADCAAGGQGAPLVPLGDWVLFRGETDRAILNLGGIANLTWLPADGGIEDVIAFDTGPGCCLIDHVLRHRGLEVESAGGHIEAGLGSLDEGFARRVLEDHPFLERRPPKSTDGPEWIDLFVRHRREHVRHAVEETHYELATAATITAIAVARALDHLPGEPTELFLAGGGARNTGLVAAIEDHVNHREPPRSVRLAMLDELGVPGQAREACCFALLAAATLDGEPGNVPRATGASRPVILGSVTPLA
jgi:anhydro-N-acetylmuramic acid kinase